MYSQELQTSTLPKSVFYAASLGVALLTFLVYLPSLGSDFVNWDDDFYVYDNPAIRSLTPEMLRYAFSTPVGPNWHPLTMVSLALDYSLWGSNPFGYHLTNVILHTINTLLVFVLAVRLFEAAGAAGSAGGRGLVAATAAAAIFGLHPLRVESVVWVTERKDVLFALFFLLGILSYIKYVASCTRAARGYYIGALTLFALSVMAKAMAVTFPAVLLILDFFPFKRLGTFKRALLEKVPFFALAAVFSALTVWVVHAKGFMYPAYDLSVIERVLVALRGYGFYLYKMALPFGLAPLYPLPSEPALVSLEYASSLLLFLGISVACVLLLRKSRVFMAAWLFYLVTLLPVIGILQVGGQAVADRFSYVPLLGPTMLAALGAALVFDRVRERGRYGAAARAALLTATFLALALLSYKTVLQTRIWKDSVTLWTYEVKLYPDTAYQAHFHLGNAYTDKGRTLNAIPHYIETIRIRPNHKESRFMLAEALVKLGRLGEAAGEFEAFIRLDPDYAQARFKLAEVYRGLGRNREAMAQLNEGIRLSGRR